MRSPVRLATALGGELGRDRGELKRDGHVAESETRFVLRSIEAVAPSD